MPESSTTYRVQQGEYWKIEISMRPEQDGPPDDLTGYTPSASMRRAIDPDAASQAITTTLVDDPDTGDPNRRVRCELLTSTTRALKTGQYRFSVELEPPAGSEYTEVILTGTIEITRELTV